MSGIPYGIYCTATDDRDYYLTRLSDSFLAMWRRDDGRSEWWIGLGMLLWGGIGLVFTTTKSLSQPHWAWEMAAAFVGLIEVWAALANATDRVRVVCNIAAVSMLMGIEVNLICNLHTIYQGAAFNFVLTGMAFTSAMKKAGRPGVWCRGR